uniref:Uncharacterized protein n=1 Tax=Romanomermis culicivorax TaxID=13658 RepID=A0A915JF85_ROMCU
MSMTSDECLNRSTHISGLNVAKNDADNVGDGGMSDFEFSDDAESPPEDNQHLKRVKYKFSGGLAKVLAPFTKTFFGGGCSLFILGTSSPDSPSHVALLDDIFSMIKSDYCSTKIYHIAKLYTDNYIYT